MPDDPPLRVWVGDGRGRPLRIPGLTVWLRKVAPRRARGTVSIALVSDRRMCQLNRRFRGQNYATDVLSFPHDQSKPSHPQSQIPNPNSDLGEVVIARGVARRQARDARHSELSELRVLALHGLLHLLGYDHERDNGAMRRVERRLRRKGGLSAGLIERGTL